MTRTAPLGQRPALVLARMIRAAFASSRLGLRIHLDRLAAHALASAPRWLSRNGQLVDLRPLHARLSRGASAVDLCVPFVNLTFVLESRGLRVVGPDWDLETGPLAERLQNTKPLLPPTTDRDGLGQVLLAHDLLSPRELRHVLAIQAEVGGRLGEHLVLQGLLTNDGLSAALAEHHGLPAIKRLEPRLINPRTLDARALAKLPVLPLVSARRELARFAVAQPSEALRAKLESLTTKAVLLVACPQHLLEQYRARYLEQPFVERRLPSPPSEDHDALSAPTIRDRATPFSTEPPDTQGLSRYADALLGSRSESEVVGRAFDVWSSEVISGAFLRFVDGRWAETRVTGMNPSQRRDVVEGSATLISSRPLFDVAARRRPAVFPGDSEDEGQRWLRARLGAPSDSPLAVLPLHGGNGRLLALLLGFGRPEQVNECRLELIMASLRAALRMVRARGTLEQLSVPQREFPRTSEPRR